MTPKANTVCPLCGSPNECVPARTGSFENASERGGRSPSPQGLSPSDRAAPDAPSDVYSNCDKEGACWCRDVTFDPAVLARIPAAQRGESCICPKCASERSAHSAQQS